MNKVTKMKPVPDTAREDPETVETAKPRRRGRRIALMLIVPLVLLAGGGYLWLAGGRYQETENANLHQAKVSIASDLSGRVVEVDVADNQLVHRGDVLFRLDPKPYKLALSEANTAISAARLNVEQMKAAYRQAQAQEEVARDDVSYMQTELDRQKALSDRGVATAATLDESQHALRKAKEQLSAAEQGTASARAALGDDPDAPTDQHPKVQAALAAKERAEYNLSLATVRAPADGTVYQAASFTEGQFVSAGSPLFSLVEVNDVWVDANFKETQLTNIAAGQSAEVEFDTLPGKTYRATVEAIGAGTGAEFSLLPAQNATGNWVKVTQRVPVRLKLDEAISDPVLVSGASATVTVDTEVSRSVLGVDLASLH